jgi:hypothetical protein
MILMLLREVMLSDPGRHERCTSTLRAALRVINRPRRSESEREGREAQGLAVAGTCLGCGVFTGSETGCCAPCFQISVTFLLPESSSFVARAAEP